MQIKFKNNTIVFYINKIIETKEEIEKYIKKIINKLKLIYNIELKGFYLVNVYINKHYGSIFEIKDEDINFLNKLDLEIKIIKNPNFLYQIDYNILKKNQIAYKYKDKFYIDKLTYNMIEFSNVIYGDECLKIIKKCKKVKI